MTSVLSSSEGMMELMQAYLLVICHGVEQHISCECSY